MLLVSIIAGIVPMVLYPVFLYWMDRYEKEPLPLILSVFLWGFVPAAILSLISQLILGIPFLLIDETGALGDFVGASVLAPITEEIFKGMAVGIVFLLWKNEFDGVFDGIIYGSLVGFGFAAIENILYFVSFGLSGQLFLFRAVLFGLNHAFFTSLIGIGFGIARHARSGLMRFTAPLVGLLAAMTMHAIHNVSVSLAGNAPGSVLLAFISSYGGTFFVFIIMVLAIRRERQWIIDNLQDEIALATLSDSQFQVAYRPIRRLSTGLNALMTSGPAGWLTTRRYFNLLTDLAYRKHAYSRRGEHGATQELIEKRRGEAAAMSREMTTLTG